MYVIMYISMHLKCQNPYPLIQDNFMDPKNTISISEARKRIFEIAEEVQKPDNYFYLTEKGRPKAVIMSVDDFESWQETIEVVSEFPDIYKRIEKVEKDIKSGAYKKYATLEEVMAKHGYVLADKGKIKYGVADKNRKRGKKRPQKNS